jgi:hypothetical protein
MAKNLGNKVSRVLDVKNKSLKSIIYQQKRPPLDSEFNLMQDIQNENISNILKEITPSGFLNVSKIEGAPENRSLLNSSWKNVVKFKNPYAIVNGWLIHIGGGTNQFQANAQQDIWKELSNDLDEIVFLLSDPPLTAHRQDLIFLEVWESVLKTSDPVFKDGFIQSSLPSFENDLIDTNLEIETSQRTQVQYRFRRANGVDFISFREGLGHASATAQGPLASPNNSYRYSKHPTDVGLYVSGDGSSKSKTDLGTVDGYIYALPICRVHRKNRTAYSNFNQNGSANSILSSAVSDRPDGLFHDEINDGDIEDLRHTVSLDGFDLQKILNENLYKLWTATLPGELKSSPNDENVIGNKIIQIDGISTSVIQGVDTQNRIPDGIRRSFTEAKEIQKISFGITNPVFNGGKLWFVPKGKKENPWEYELWDENIFYPRIDSIDYRPKIIVWDESSKVRTEISGGQWYQLGEYRLFDYIQDECKNRIEFQPENIAELQNKAVIFMFDFITREGGGIGQVRGGFNFKIHKMLAGFNNKDSSEVEVNHYQSASNVKILKNPRTVISSDGDENTIDVFYTDTALTRSISRFEESSIPTSALDEKYRGACIEITYHLISTGSATVNIPRTVYGRSVFGVFSGYNITRQSWLSYGVQKTSESYELSGLVVGEQDVLAFTLLCGNYTADYIPHAKGISNFARNYIFQSSVSLASGLTGVINVKKDSLRNLCDGVLANCGYYNGNRFVYVGYLNNRQVEISEIEGLGTPVIKYTLAQEPVSPGVLDIHFLGYYNPDLPPGGLNSPEADRFYFTYQHIPYKGTLRTRLPSGRLERFKILKLDEKIAVTTAGSGSRDQYVPDDLKGLINNLPLNSSVREYNFFGSNIEYPLNGGNSSLRLAHGRGPSQDNFNSNNSFLFEGQVISLGTNTNAPMLRGATLRDPVIHERGFDFNVPTIRDNQGNLLQDPLTGQPYDIVFKRDMSQYNHLTQWSAIVEGIDSYRGELFLLVITTTSTVYNRFEGLEYTYLELKDLYRNNALGRGKETILRNDLSANDLNQLLGRKIIGAADIIPLEGRPLARL